MARLKNGLTVLVAIVVTVFLAGPIQADGQPAHSGEAGMLHFKPLIVNDPFVEQEAFRLLVPADWRASGKVEWRFHPQYPAAGWVVASNPAGVEAVHTYPMIPFVAGVWHLPAGGHYLGNEVRPNPGDITGYVRYYLLPRFRPDVRSYRVVSTEPMPEWANASTVAQSVRGTGIPCRVAAGRVRIAYQVNGQDVEE
ncbi:MAG TPA: hypothetical protein VFA18_08270, partial [Gemmataceae bacterium]|nr:hypothetical protein [Gemmataceae bacterium]